MLTVVEWCRILSRMAAAMMGAPKISLHPRASPNVCSSKRNNFAASLGLQNLDTPKRFCYLSTQEAPSSRGLG